MSKDVEAAREKLDREQHAEAAAAASCAENEEERHNFTCLQLMPMEELVPLSQSLISPTLARLFNLNKQPPPDTHSPLPQRCAPGANPSERLHSHYVELQRMQQLQEDDLIRTFEEDDETKHSPNDPCRMHIMVSGSPLQEGKGNVRGAGFKRSYVNAGTSDSYGIQLSDADTPDDHAEGFGMNQLMERENSSNSGEGGAGSGGNGAGSSGARTLKRPRLVWTPQLHKRFFDAVSHLGIKNAVPKTIMQLMNVDGLTRENVASHLQKYRLHLRRVQHGSLFSSCGSSPTKSILGGLDHPHHNGLVGAPISPVGGNADHLFSASEIPSTIMASTNRHPTPTQNRHHLPGNINHLIPQHMPNLLLQPVPQQQFSQPMAMVKPSPFNITHQHLDPRCFTTNVLSTSSPMKKAAWPPPHASFMDISAGHHTENHSAAAPSSPPRRALTLFPH